MNRIFMSVAASMLLFAMHPAKATIPTTQKQLDQLAKPAQATTRMVQQAFLDIQRNDIDSGQEGLDKAIHSKGFTQLPVDLRYKVLWIASLLADKKGQSKKAHDLSVRATAFDAADNTAWLTRLYSAFSISDYHDAAHSIAVVAQRWPDKLDNVFPGGIFQLHHQLWQTKDFAVDREMLDALFDAKWKNEGNEPSILWRDLALLHLERDDLDRATTVALRITSGQVALSMRVDKRFDPITGKHAEAFDVDRLTAAEIKAAQARMKAHPDQLAPIADLQLLYLATRQYARILSISDAAVAHAKHGDIDTTYTDFADQYNWILDNRSRAFQREGRWKDAVRVEILAARRPENGGMNVSQLINLGYLYANLAQPDKAANAIVELGDMSPFGRMQLEYLKLQIAVEKNDEAAATTAMDYLRKHRTDAMHAWENALLLRGKLDAAAAVLIERLKNPNWRTSALVDMQQYADVTRTPVQKNIHDRWNVIVARSDVQAAMHEVGRVEQFHLAPPPH